MNAYLALTRLTPEQAHTSGGIIALDACKSFDETGVWEGSRKEMTEAKTLDFCEHHALLVWQVQSVVLGAFLRHTFRGSTHL